ncbi:hypothetical protein C8P66_12132 [Humitalea rosea]|uniref:Uncharacterized protein n=2 Tax=Humitalea rosea TaxID=990373 RepID=A0A2W7I8A7_9PROT|nr:hypothetical protein C8P66_12132 [Humitalea rosea]
MVIGMVLSATFAMLVLCVPIYAVAARFMPRVRAAVAAPLLLLFALVLSQLLFMRSRPEQVFNDNLLGTLFGFLVGITAFLIVMLLAWVHYTVPRPKR